MNLGLHPHLARPLCRLLAGAALPLLLPLALTAQVVDRPPDRPDGEGEGPFERLVLRGATLIDGTGAPPIGPVDIVIENDRITDIRIVGYPGVPVRPEARPEAGTREIDLEGKYVLPGFIDMHTHQHTLQDGQAVPVNYVHKLWMAHGITTVRDVASFQSLDWLLETKDRSGRNEITAPRTEIMLLYGMGSEGLDMLSLFRPGGPFETEEEARAWVQDIATRGADGIKFLGGDPDVLKAAIDEANNQGIRTTMHHAQMSVSQLDALESAKAGLTSMEHWYGLPEALFADRLIQDYPVGYNYQNEQHRFGEAGRLWAQAAEPGSERWEAVMDTLLSLDFTLSPTFTIYSASRDLMRSIRADWHEVYTMPSLWDFYRPNREAHGSYWFHWTTHDEIEWKRNYAKWMRFVNEYKNRGGRVVVGSDSGYIFQLYGFGFIQEMELLQEAGFHPLEVIWSATLKGAEALGLDDEIGSVQIGKKADLVILDEDPLENLKMLYGTGWIRLNDDTGEVERVGGVRWTVKDGIVYDAQAMLDDVRRMVEEAKAERGIPPGPMPVETRRPVG